MFTASAYEAAGARGRADIDPFPRTLILSRGRAVTGVRTSPGRGTAWITRQQPRALADRNDSGIHDYHQLVSAHARPAAPGFGGNHSWVRREHSHRIEREVDNSSHTSGCAEKTMIL
ncbi:hypothetical protein [Frankia sp. CiP3]|uniref:hypothetical protein n=1 Tax=Frankia sp. CiP3 TaxID=2880971 RepID=UPI001EF70FF4|nr:hypothetical protein [Frankia sp. CiP3]